MSLSSPDLPVEAESGDAALPVPVVAAAAAASVQPGEGAPEDAAGRAADGAPEAAAASAGGPLLLHAGHGARPAERPEGRYTHADRVYGGFFKRKTATVTVYSPKHAVCILTDVFLRHETSANIWFNILKPAASTLFLVVLSPTVSFLQ